MTDLVICSNTTTLHAPQAAMHKLVILGAASKNPRTVQVSECTVFCNTMFSTKNSLFCSTSSLKGVQTHKPAPWLLTAQLVNKMSEQLGRKNHLIFSCVLLFVFRQSCLKCVSAALRITNEIPTVGYCKGTAWFLSWCVVMPGEELVLMLFALSAREKQERFLLGLVKTPVFTKSCICNHESFWGFSLSFHFAQFFNSCQQVVPNLKRLS